MTTKLNLKINQGATYKHTIYWTNDADLPINILGFTARMQARLTHSSTNSLIDLTTENGRIIIGNATNGEIRLYISAADTANMDWSSGVYDLEMVSPLGDVTRLIEGKISVSKEVTR